MPKKHLGQHFLYDHAILKQIINAADLSEEDTVVEIGPGPGKLTQLLAERAKKVIAIELDKMLCEQLRETFIGRNAARGTIEIIHGDALKFPYEELEDFKVVANIPYYITTPLIFRLLHAKRVLKTMTLTIQKEVAERIVAMPGKKDYGVLSIMVQYHAFPVLKFTIPKEAFRPAPKVDSAVVHIAIPDTPSLAVRDEMIFARVVRTAFAQRRKTLANSLKALRTDIRGLLLSAGIDPRRRPETVSIAEFAMLSDLLVNRTSQREQNCA